MRPRKHRSAVLVCTSCVVLALASAGNAQDLAEPPDALQAEAAESEAQEPGLQEAPVPPVETVAEEKEGSWLPS